MSLLEEKINFSVFPGLQGGPHQHQIAGLATQLLEVSQPEFKDYIRQVRDNTQVLGKYLVEKDFNISTGGSDNHIILINLRNKGITGSKIEKLCEKCDISLNKNAILGDKSAISPGGVRIGTAALTTRGFKENDILCVGELLYQCVELGLEIQKDHKPLKEFMKNMENYQKEIEIIKAQVNNFAEQFEFIEY